MAGLMTNHRKAKIAKAVDEHVARIGKGVGHLIESIDAIASHRDALADAIDKDEVATEAAGLAKLRTGLIAYRDRKPS